RDRRRLVPARPLVLPPAHAGAEAAAVSVEQALQGAVFAVLWLLLGLFLVVATVDVVLALLGARSVGHRVQRWARHYPLFAASIIFVFGALLGHFFTQP